MKSELQAATLLRAALERHGYAVREACDPVEARDVLARRAPSLVVVGAPSEEAIELSLWLRAQPFGPSVPLLWVLKDDDRDHAFSIEEALKDAVVAASNEIEVNDKIAALAERRTSAMSDELGDEKPVRAPSESDWYRALVQHSVDVVTVLDPDGMRRYVSPSVENLLGWKPADLIGKSFFAIINEGDVDSLAAVFHNVVAHPDQHLTTSSRFRRIDGSWVTAEVIFTNMLRDPDIRGIVMTSRDITQRRKVEAALRESDERFRGSFDQAPIGIALVGTDGRWLDANKALCEIVGYRKSELLNLKFQDITHPDDLADDLSQISRMLTGQISTYQIEKRYIHRDGQPIWVLVSISLVHDAEGAPSYFVAQIMNIDGPRHMQEALRRSEQRFRSLVQHSSDIIMILDEHAVVRTVSPVVQRILGYSPAEIVGSTEIDFAHPDDRASLRRGFVTCRRTPGNQVSLQARFQHRDRSWKWLEIMATNLLEDETVHGIVVNARDVTERTWNERTTALVKQIAIAIGDASGLNEALSTTLGSICKSIGWSAAEFWALNPAKTEMNLSRAWWGQSESASVFHKASADFVFSAVQGVQGHIIQSGEPEWMPDIATITDFQRRDLAQAAGFRSALAAPVRIGGEIVGAALFFSEIQIEEDQQITKTVTSTIAELDAVLLAKRHEESRRRSEERFRSLVQHGSDVIWVIGPSGERHYVSPSIERILGYTAEEFLGVDGPSLVSPQDMETAQRYMMRLAATPLATVSVELRLQHKDGTQRWFEIIGINQLHDPAVDGIVMNGRDITERKQAETELAEALAVQQAANAQLKELNKAKSDFVSVVSHEFRTPLTSIQGFAEIIEHEDALGEKTRREFASLIYGEALRLGRLISEMLDLDRMESGRMVLGRESVNLGELIRKTVRQIAPNSANHTFAVEIDEHVPNILADRDKVIQVLSNLLSNAVKYSPNGGEVSVGLDQRPGWAHIWIRDQGIGIPQEALEAVFERYTRVDPNKNRRIHGTGLGLAIVRQIVAMHEGRVWVESVTGKGSTFHIELPLAVAVDATQPVLA